MLVNIQFQQFNKKNRMPEKLVSFQTARIAKEKGFRISTKHYFEDLENELFCGENKDDSWFEANTDSSKIYARPTQIELHNWLKTVHNIQIQTTELSEVVLIDALKLIELKS